MNDALEKDVELTKDVEKISHQQGYENKVKVWEETLLRKYPTPEQKKERREKQRKENYKLAKARAKRGE